MGPAAQPRSETTDAYSAGFHFAWAVLVCELAKTSREPNLEVLTAQAIERHVRALRNLDDRQTREIRHEIVEAGAEWRFDRA